MNPGANLIIGQSAAGSNTGVPSTGNFDMTGGTFNATLDELVLGRKPNVASSTISGSLTTVAGTVDVNSISLGIRTDAGTAGTAAGSLNIGGTTAWTVNGNVTLTQTSTAAAPATATINQTGGSITVNGNVLEGGTVGGTSTLNVSGGTFSVSNSSATNSLQNIDTVLVGDAGGTGTLNILSTGGTHNVVTSLIVGGTAGSTGTVSLAGGTFTVPATITTAVIGASGKGTFDQNGGTVNWNRTLLLGQNGGSQGIYDISAGALNVIGAANDLVVGVNGGTALNPSQLLVSGTGTVTTPDLVVGQNATAVGAVVQTGGTINVTNTSTYLVGAGSGADGTGAAGVGSVSQSGGVTNVTGSLIIGNQVGSATENRYSLSGGVLDFGDTTGVTAGAYYTTGSTPSALTINSDATFNFTGGSLQDVTAINTNNGGGIGSGTFVQGGGRFFIGQDEPTHVVSPRKQSWRAGYFCPHHHHQRRFLANCGHAFLRRLWSRGHTGRLFRPRTD